MQRHWSTSAHRQFSEPPASVGSVTDRDSQWADADTNGGRCAGRLRSAVQLPIIHPCLLFLALGGPLLGDFSRTAVSAFNDGPCVIRDDNREGISVLNPEGHVLDLGSPLNGYPAVNQRPSRHGMPLQVRHGTRDPRLLAELTFGAGIAAFEGGELSYNLPYFRDYPIEHSVRRWRYVDQLAGRYQTKYRVQRGRSPHSGHRPARPGHHHDL
jgi:hypothetical protein